jgi:hypothetical protein
MLLRRSSRLIRSPALSSCAVPGLAVPGLETCISLLRGHEAKSVSSLKAIVWVCTSCGQRVGYHERPVGGTDLFNTCETARVGCSEEEWLLPIALLDPLDRLGPLYLPQSIPQWRADLHRWLEDVGQWVRAELNRASKHAQSRRDPGQDWRTWNPSRRSDRGGSPPMTVLNVFVWLQ